MTREKNTVVLLLLLSVSVAASGQMLDVCLGEDARPGIYLLSSQLLDPSSEGELTGVLLVLSTQTAYCYFSITHPFETATANLLDGPPGAAEFIQSLATGPAPLAGYEPLRPEFDWCALVRGEFYVTVGTLVGMLAVEPISTISGSTPCICLGGVPQTEGPCGYYQTFLYPLESVLAEEYFGTAFGTFGLSGESGTLTVLLSHNVPNATGLYLYLGLPTEPGWSRYQLNLAEAITAQGTAITLTWADEICRLLVNEAYLVVTDVLHPMGVIVAPIILDGGPAAEGEGEGEGEGELAEGENPETAVLFVGVTGEGSVTRAPAGEQGPVAGLFYYPYDSEVQLQATPAEGWRFEYWSGASVQDLSSETANARIILNGDKYLLANFVPDTGGEGEYDPCIAACPASSPDLDGDGLSGCVEACLETSDENTDTDGDGMADGFEFQYGLNLFEDDSGIDLDGDDLTNLEEFLGRTDPTTAEDTFFVAPSPLGFDRESNTGSWTRPWATIAYALTRLDPSEERPLRLVVRGGVYRRLLGALRLKAGIRIAAATGEVVRLEGPIIGAAGAVLERVEVFQDTGTDPLLDLDGGFMRLIGVTFRGGPLRDAPGLELSQNTVRPSLIDGCLFTSLSLGIDVAGAFPVLRRSVFEDLSGPALRVRAWDGGAPQKQGGNQLDPNAGYNTFKSTVPNPAVVNERDETLPLEENDWDTDDPEEIAERVEGDVDYEPFLPKGSAILAAALFCSVWDADDLTPIENASVSLLPGSYSPVTENDEGVYSFAAVSPGSYSVTVTAPGYGGGGQSVSLDGGDLVSIAVPLEYTGGTEGEPEGEVEPPPNGCQCFNKAAPAGLPDSADALVNALGLLVLCFAAYRMRGAG